MQLTFLVLVSVKHDHKLGIKQTKLIVLLYLAADLTIGFNTTNYVVNESDGFVSVTMGVLEGFIGEGVSIDLELTTQNGSAEGKIFARLISTTCAIILLYQVTSYTVAITFSYIRLRRI